MKQWQRAETLGALVNGVFLVALCVSIFLEAIQRLVEPQTVSNPKFVCIVGCLGLLSNILGLVLFHDHSHGGHGHSHGSAADHDDVEQGHHGHDHSSNPQKNNNNNNKANGKGASNGATLDGTTGRRYTLTGRDVDDIEHPARLRQGIIAAGHTNIYGAENSSESDSGDADADDVPPSERSTLLGKQDRFGPKYTDGGSRRAVEEADADEELHRDHQHAQPKPKDGHGHGHGHGHGGGHDLNMRGVFLHVMGDALGNIGVIASALIIWLTNYSWKHYVDPGISLLITVIILASAIPLCKAASRILLQAAPRGLSIDHIKDDIEQLPGVNGSHHLHVWQLSDTKIVASIHIQVDTEIKGEGSERYMRLARQVRRCLHAYGIHSSTIQPEFAPESDVEDNTNNQSGGGPSSSRASHHDPNSSSSKIPSRDGSVRDVDPQACLLECDDNCANGGQCCPKP